jgi:Bacterial antitoxin of type II TA system, VapB
LAAGSVDGGRLVIWCTGASQTQLNGIANSRFFARPSSLHQHDAMYQPPHKEYRMASHLTMDPELLEKVLAISGESTVNAAVTLALKEFIARREQRRS